MTATPRDLDPKFKDVPVPSEETTQAPVPVQQETNNIVWKRQVRNDKGEYVEEVHGPMPVEEWSAYEKKHGL